MAATSCEKVLSGGGCPAPRIVRSIWSNAMFRLPVAGAGDGCALALVAPNAITNSAVPDTMDASALEIAMMLRIEAFPKATGRVHVRCGAGGRPTAGQGDRMVATNEYPNL